MSNLILTIGNKNYSSWSLRPWLQLQASGIEFEECRIPLHTEQWHARRAERGPSGLVPSLRHDSLVIWDSLAIFEYVRERFAPFVGWPESIQRRALARAVSAEMHSGMHGLRREMPMNIRRQYPSFQPSHDAQADIDRVCEIWRGCLQQPPVDAEEGPFLFGRLCIADCMYAPVVLRFKTYSVSLSPPLQAYCNAILELPAMQRWIAAAEVETEILPHNELSSEQA